jgi:hypothetical protein
MTEPIYVVWWNFERDVVKCHSTTMLSDTFPDTECAYVYDFADLPPDTGAIVVVSGGFGWADRTQQIENVMSRLQDKIAALPWVVVVTCYDACSHLRVDHLQHPRMKIWVQEPKPGPGTGNEGRIPAIGMLNHHAYRRVPVGYTRTVLDFLPKFDLDDKLMPWFFAGRMDQEWRADWTAAIAALPEADDCLPISRVSTSFYVGCLAMAKVVPCRPSITPETARVYEALEAGCIPIVASVSGAEGWNVRYDWTHYWEYVLGEPPPFPVIPSPGHLADAVRKTLDNWDEQSKLVRSWWADYKVRLARDLRAEVEGLR